MIHVFNMYINIVVSFVKAIYCGLQPTNEKAMEKFNEMDWSYINCLDYLFQKKNVREDKWI